MTQKGATRPDVFKKRREGGSFLVHLHPVPEKEKKTFGDEFILEKVDTPATQSKGGSMEKQKTNCSAIGEQQMYRKKGRPSSLHERRKRLAHT